MPAMPAQVRDCRARSEARRPTSWRRLPRGRPCSSAWRSGAGSCRRIAKTNRPDTTKLTASARIASGAVTKPMRPPPSAGPGALRDASATSRACRCRRRAGRARRATAGTTGRRRRRARSASRPRTRRRRAAPSSGRRGRYAIGTVASTTARPMSPAMRIGRRRSRSTHAPAGRLNRMNGRNSIGAEQPPPRTGWRPAASPPRAGSRAG